MKRRSTVAFAALSLALALPGCNSTEPEAEPASQTPLTVTDSIEATVTAKVKAIDHANRMITLADDSGHQIRFPVDRSVQRLHEVLAGDNVIARYKATLMAELRPPTAEEAADPIAVVEVAGRSPDGATPAAGVAQAVRVVTTVEAIDAPNMRVTLRGPMGDLSVVRARNAENVKRLRVGDTIVITFAESLAISLEKVAP